MTYDAIALMNATGLNHSEAAKKLRISGARWHELRERGLTEAEADRFAVRLGLHPGSVWSSWWTEKFSVDVLMAHYALQRAAWRCEKAKASA